MESRIKHFYNAILAFGGILGIYKSFIPGVSLFEIILGLFLLTIIMQKKRSPDTGEADTEKNNSNKWLFLIVLYAWITFLLGFAANQINDIFYIHRVLRFSLYCLIPLYVSRDLFAIKLYIRYSIIVVFITFFALLYQYMMYYLFGSYIILYDKLLKISSESYMLRDYSRLIESSGFRPSGFFLEPSHLAQNFILVLICTLFTYDSKEKHMYGIMACILSIIMSTSLWGLGLLCMVLLVWFFNTSRGKILQTITSLMVFGIIIYEMQKIVLQTLSRIDFSDISEDTTFSGRFLGYEELTKLNTYQRLFGMGFGYTDEATYLNSILYLLLGVGIIGTIGYLVFIASYAIKNNAIYIRLSAITFLALLFGSSIIVSSTSVLFYSVIMGSVCGSILEKEVHSKL